MANENNCYTREVAMTVALEIRAVIAPLFDFYSDYFQLKRWLDPWLTPSRSDLSPLYRLLTDDDP